MSLKRREFKVLSTWIYDTLGVKMPPTKLILLESRLQKRLRALGMEKFNSYIEYVFSEDGCAQELPFMVDLVTTHQTDFFREEAHFDFLTQTALPELIQRFEVGTHRPLQLWSAASSTGEEAYTLGIVLEEFLRKQQMGKTFQYEILGTDISSGVLEKAREAIYPESRLGEMPQTLLRRYFLRSKDRERTEFRVVPELRAKARFRLLNLMDERYRLPEMDLIFCRNVLIYFNKPTQEHVLQCCCQHLRSGGFLFVGHTETVHQFNLPVLKRATSVLQKQ